MPSKRKRASTKIIKRPSRADRGLAPTSNDRLVQFSVEYGSERLLAAIVREHPRIVALLTRVS